MRGKLCQMHWLLQTLAWAYEEFLPKGPFPRMKGPFRTQTHQDDNDMCKTRASGGGLYTRSFLWLCIAMSCVGVLGGLVKMRACFLYCCHRSVVWCVEGWCASCLLYVLSMLLVAFCGLCLNRAWRGCVSRNPSLTYFRPSLQSNPC